jgi:hypothetical protein
MLTTTRSNEIDSRNIRSTYGYARVYPYPWAAVLAIIVSVVVAQYAVRHGRLGAASPVDAQAADSHADRESPTSVAAGVEPALLANTQSAQNAHVLPQMPVGTLPVIAW